MIEPNLDTKIELAIARLECRQNDYRMVIATCEGWPNSEVLCMIARSRIAMCLVAINRLKRFLEEDVWTEFLF